MVENNDRKETEEVEVTNDIKVTVVCITYNHEEFIAQALDSFLMQKTNFKFQIFVGEDCGPDRTADIVREYAEKYPDIVIPFIREKNMGAQRNLIDLCNHATSPYIAFCEGDDYWTDEYKLQKQYDYMEANPEVRVCFAKAEIKAPEDWFLNSYYKKDEQGRMIFPDSDPEYRPLGKHITAWSFINMFSVHTSTVFYRWNYELEIPDWFYTGIIGDLPIFLMQLGDGEAGFIEDIVSVYRRSDVGVYMSSSMDEHFLKSRIDLIRVFSGMLTYYEEHMPNKYPKVAIENRIKWQSSLLIKTAIKLERMDEIVKFIELYPDAAKMALDTYIGFYNDSRRMTAVYTWEGNKAVARDRYFMRVLKPVVKFYLVWKRRYRKLKDKTKKRIVYLAKLAGYWGYALVPKKKNIWAFSSFYKRGYMDNTKYFYEYLVENEPDIRPIWFTRDNKVYTQLQEEGKEVYKMNSLKGVWMMAKAAVAVTDHFVMSDYSSIYGFNHKTKVVQLWHGVGFKALADGTKIVNSDVPGMQYSYDILPQEGDSTWMQLKKRVRFFFKAPVRELFERYYMFVCPGKERTMALGQVLNIPEKAYFFAGHPRNLPLYQTEIATDPYKILYAPTYRFSALKERKLLNDLFENLEQVQALMEELNAEFVLRMHPHTWRNYKLIIEEKIKAFDRISLDEEKDIYTTLASYSVVITDYSSIALDFAMLGRPTIYHTSDYDWFMKNEAGFTGEFTELITGPQTFQWDETLDHVRQAMEHPELYREMAKEKRSYYFQEDVNTENNSALICKGLKQRLGITE